MNPSTVTHGTSGLLFIAGLRAGELTEWRVVLSPTTKMPTLFGKGKIGRYYIQSVGGLARLELTPAPIPRRIGRKAAAPLRPFVLVGAIAEITSKTITISHGAVEQNKVL